MSTPMAMVTDQQAQPPTLLGDRRAQRAGRPRTATTAGRSHTNGSSQARSGRAIIRRPLNSISPEVGSRMPATTLKKVVLPAPLGPMRLTIEPLRDDQVGAVDGDQAAEALGDRTWRAAGSRRSARPSSAGPGTEWRLHAVRRRHASSPRPAWASGSMPSTSAPAFIHGVQLRRSSPAREQAFRPQQHHAHQRQAVQQELVLQEVDVATGSARGTCRTTC